MAKELGKLNKTANLLGFDLSFFAGIPIAAIPLYFVFDNYKDSLLNFLGLNILGVYQQNIIILMLTLLASVIIYKISGWCLDWIYDDFYKKTDRELNMYINSARKKWITSNQIYDNPNIVEIYKPTLEKVQNDNRNEYQKIKATLSLSKIFRIIVIPTLILGILKVTSKDFFAGTVCVIIAVICLFISFNYRAEHSKRLYRWFISST